MKDENSDLKSLYKREYEIYDNFKEIAANNNQTVNHLVALSELCNHYLQLLKQTSRMTHQSDVQQARLIDAKEKIEKTTKELESEKKKSDALLSNILPAHIAEELKSNGSVVPRRHKSVSILFTDFVGFTRIAGKISAEELIQELSGCFYQFDEITQRNKVKKLKTMGDSYMCCAGLKNDDNAHPVHICLAALEIKKIMDQTREIKETLGLDYWELRIGIHTGPVTSGVVGKSRFAYDIWGESVNTASRMESSGTPGRINISETTYEKVKYFFDCQYRGKINAKSLGKIDMYYLNSIKPEFSIDNDGIRPNKKFQNYCDLLDQGKVLRYRSELSKKSK